MDWLHSDVENRALDYGIDVLSAEHLAEVRSRTLARVAKVEGRWCRSASPARSPTGTTGRANCSSRPMPAGRPG